VVSQIVSGRIWNPEKYTVGTKGTEMERRLIGAFDGGLRAGEMLLIQIKHVDWRTVKIVDKDGKQITCYLIKLPPSVTKGGKTSGKIEAIPEIRRQLPTVAESYRHGFAGIFAERWSGREDLNLRPSVPNRFARREFSSDFADSRTRVVTG